MNERKPVIAAFIGMQTLGDFLTMNMVAASVARALGGRLVVAYRDDRPYKNFIAALNPWTIATVKTPDDPNVVLPMDWFDGVGDGAPFDAAQRAAGCHRPDLILLPSMLDVQRMLPPAPRFRIPPRAAPVLEDALVGRGLDRRRWFATLHVREPAYVYRRVKETVRNVDPLTYMPMIRRITEDLGGQVVRLGDPSMKPLPPMPGLIDLSRDSESFPEQAFAVSRSRFFVATDTGPSWLGAAFHVPTGLTNTLTSGVMNPGDVVMMKHFRWGDEGRPLTEDESRLFFSVALFLRPNLMAVDENTPDELVSVAQRLFDKTADCFGWRPPVEEPLDPPEGAPGTGVPLPWRDFSTDCGLEFLPREGVPEG